MLRAFLLSIPLEYSFHSLSLKSLTLYLATKGLFRPKPMVCFLFLSFWYVRSSNLFSTFSSLGSLTPSASLALPSLYSPIIFRYTLSSLLNWSLLLKYIPPPKINFQFSSHESLYMLPWRFQSSVQFFFFFHSAITYYTSKMIQDMCNRLWNTKMKVAIKYKEFNQITTYLIIYFWKLNIWPSLVACVPRYHIPGHHCCRVIPHTARMNSSCFF